MHAAHHTHGEGNSQLREPDMRRASSEIIGLSSFGMGDLAFLLILLMAVPDMGRELGVFYPQLTKLDNLVVEIMALGRSLEEEVPALLPWFKNLAPLTGPSRRGEPSFTNDIWTHDAPSRSTCPSRFRGAAFASKRSNRSIQPELNPLRFVFSRQLWTRLPRNTGADPNANV
ncbi:hypothetical protein BGZ60DRAFT_429265 [Tricladium varicosporioides]|nr:hypothetical protein BGZ60DRAFT_429265 [Hymenoscyphus varicosporioides]